MDEQERAEESKLGELVYAEIKKAFSICDRDGNGHLDVSEVRAVMKVLLVLSFFVPFVSFSWCGELVCVEIKKAFKRVIVMEMGICEVRAVMKVPY